MSRRFRLTRSSASVALLAPPLVLFLLFFVAPLLSLFWASLHTASDNELYGPALTSAHYVTILTDPFYHTIILRTLGTGAVILLLCLVLGYATAYVLAPLPPRRRLLLLALLVLPLMVSNVVRAYGWIAILGRQGLVNSLLRNTGVIERPLVLLNSFEAVSFGLMTILLPYMVISVTNTLTAIDAQYKEAAQSLRASPVRTFIHVTWPLSSPGVASGMLLVFLLTLSAYVTITLLGGPRMKLLVSLVFDQVGAFRWPLAAALAFVLLGLALAAGGLILAVLRPQRVQGKG
jgi:ABC-type spermidine/putrescine transport system permease subunit I